MHKTIISMFLFVAISTVSMAQLAVTKELKPQTFQKELEASKEAVLIDVRTPEEVASGHIDGAENFDFRADDFRQKIGALDKNKTYFLYCASGKRSGQASLAMVEMGFKSIYTLRGGLNAWEEEKLPVVKKK